MKHTRMRAIRTGGHSCQGDRVHDRATRVASIEYAVVFTEVCRPARLLASRPRAAADATDAAVTTAAAAAAAAAGGRVSVCFYLAFALGLLVYMSY